MILVVKRRKKKKETYVEKVVYTHMHLKSKEYKPKSGNKAETPPTFCHTIPCDLNISYSVSLDFLILIFILKTFLRFMNT